MEKTNRNLLRMLAIVMLLVLAAIACQTVLRSPATAVQPDELATPAGAIPGNSPVNGDQPLPAGEQPAASNPASSSTGASLIDQDALTAIYERVSPGVVSIRTLSDQGSGLGSGFVIDKEGHILTNYHVVEGASDLEVDFPSGLKVRGSVIGTDLDSDLAIIKVVADPDQLFPLPMGDSDRLKVGQFVLAIGNPFGLSGSMTVGIISAKGRTLDSLNEAPGGAYFSAGDILQTDAAINPGNSGGPLLNLNGEVIGVNRAIRTDNFTALGSPTNSGIGFAIAINIVKRVVPSLISDGTYEYPYLGVASLPELTLLDQEQLGLPQATGAYLTQVTSGAPADKAGLKAGDLIVAIDGHEVLIFGDLLSYLLNNKSPNDEVVMTVLRGSDKLDIPVIVGRRP